MKVMRLIGSAARVLVTSGPAGVWRAARRRLEGRPEPPALREPTAIEAVGRQEMESLLARGERIVFAPAPHPEVSIVIPVHGKAAFTYLCLRSILLNTAAPPYEIIVVDDASTDDTARLLAAVDGVRVVRHAQNRGFIASCNDGAAQASGSYLCFLNNDTVVTAGWLAGLVGTFGARPGCGAAGAKLLGADGALQEAGSIIWGDGSASGYGRGEDPSRPEYNYLREVAFCSGACLVVARDAFAASGGFDGKYEPAYYEDADLCFRLREAGRAVVYQPRSSVYHIEYGTSTPAGAVRQMQRNQEVFRRAWRRPLRGRPLASPEHLLRERDERRGRRLLFIDDRIPTPEIGAGFPRAHAMVTALARLGYVVTLFPMTDSRPFRPRLEQLQQLGIEVFHRPYDDFRALLSGRAGLYDAVIVSRPHNATTAMGPIRRAWPGVPIIYDAEAVFSQRVLQEALDEGRPFSLERERALVEKELAPAADADAVIVVSEKDRELFRRAAPGRPVEVWGHAVVPRIGGRGFGDRRGALFVGGFPGAGTPNERAANILAREVWPLVRGRIDCPLTIAGGPPPEGVRALAGEGIDVVGFVEDLGEHYARSRIFVAPHRVAAGIPLKAVEAMAHGLPCVLSSLLAEQLGLKDREEALVGGDAAELADGIVALHGDELLWTRVRDAGIAYVREHCDPTLLDARLGGLVEEVVRRGRPAP